MLRHLPNALTFGRILAGLALVPLLVLPGRPYWAAALGLFLLAALTDRLDGMLARRLGHVTALGQMLDPLADKVLVAAALLGLILAGRIAGPHLGPVLLIFGREAMIMALRRWLERTGGTLPVSPLAKWKTGLQMTAIAVLMSAPLFSEDVLAPLGLVLLWIAALVTLWTGLDYIVPILQMPQTDRNRDKDSTDT